jgi:hypothetical protein
MRITVFSRETLNCSVNANPRFKLYTDEGWYKTSSDQAFCYGLWNGWTSQHDETGRVAEIELTAARRTEDLKWVD